MTVCRSRTQRPNVERTRRRLRRRRRRSWVESQWRFRFTRGTHARDHGAPYVWTKSRRLTWRRQWSTGIRSRPSKLRKRIGRGVATGNIGNNHNCRRQSDVRDQQTMGGHRIVGGPDCCDLLAPRIFPVRNCVRPLDGYRLADLDRVSLPRGRTRWMVLDPFDVVDCDIVERCRIRGFRSRAFGALLHHSKAFALNKKCPNAA